MNTNVMLRELLHRDPFRPIRIDLVSGETLRIPHPDFASVPPSSTDRYSPMFIVYSEKGHPRFINPLIVSSIEQEVTGQTKSKRRR